MGIFRSTKAGRIHHQQPRVLRNTGSSSAEMPDGNSDLWTRKRGRGKPVSERKTVVLLCDVL